MAKKTDAQIADEQGISRQAVHERRANGWTQEQIEKGEREDARPEKYRTTISDHFGMSVREYAAKEGISSSEAYRRYHAAMRKQRNKQGQKEKETA